jgi:hypothetical protein
MIPLRHPAIPSRHLSFLTGNLNMLIKN